MQYSVHGYTRFTVPGGGIPAWIYMNHPDEYVWDKYGGNRRFHSLRFTKDSGKSFTLSVEIWDDLVWIFVDGKNRHYTNARHNCFPEEFAKYIPN